MACLDTSAKSKVFDMLSFSLLTSLISHSQLADWLEFYAKAMELNVWTSANIEKLQKNQATQDWTVAIKRSDGTTRTFKPRHVIFAHGFGGGVATTSARTRRAARRVSRLDQHRSRGRVPCLRPPTTSTSAYIRLHCLKHLRCMSDMLTSSGACGITPWAHHVQRVQ